MKSAEQRLVLACARLELDTAARERLDALLGENLDWRRVLAFAEDHGLAPLLHHHLSAASPERVPKPILVELWGRYESGLRRNRAMARELLEILAVLDANAIAALPYKGPALGQAIYGDVGLREFGDLDILLRQRDAMAAKRLLEERGYASDYELSREGDRAMLHSAAHYHFALRGPRAFVELHWKTDPEFPVERDDDAWWKALARAPFEDATVLALDANDLFLVLCLHGAKHRWASIAWIVDVAEMMRHPHAIDWNAVARRADAMRTRRRCLLGVRLAHDLLDAPVPPVLSDALGNPAVGEAALAIAADLFCGAATAGPLDLLRGDLALYDRASQRWRHALHVIVSPTVVEWSRWRLPRALAFLYVPLRLARLAAKHLMRSPRTPPGATPRTPPPQRHSTG